MKLTVAIKLLPTPEQAELLAATLTRCNAAATALAKMGFEAGKFRQFDLHHLAYFKIRADYGLAAQMTVRVIAKVADAYKLQRKTSPVFRSLGAQG